MDADLQHPPHLVPLLVAEWRKGSKIVKTVRREAPDLPAFKRLTSRSTTGCSPTSAASTCESGMADFRLLDREVLQQILAFKEEGLFPSRHRAVGRLSELDGRISTAAVASPGRPSTRSLRMMRFAWHGISSFSLVPLRMGIVIGLIASVNGVFRRLLAILTKWLDSEAAQGWASSVAIISFLFGVLFIFLAVLAEYVGRILIEVRGRPRFIVSDKLDASPTTAGSLSQSVAKTIVAVDP